MDFSVLCNCVLDDNYNYKLKKLISNYNRGLESLINSGRYDTHDGFTVVIQPFTKFSKPKLFVI
jgi:hypothetical protein